MEKLTNIIEAILFAAGDAVPMDLLREKLDITKKELDDAVRQLERKYTGDVGIRLLNFNHKLQFVRNNCRAFQDGTRKFLFTNRH